MKQTVLLIAAFLAFVAGPLRAAEYMCRSISIADGLSQSYVSAIARDDAGFLWIGTRYGLNRYDFEKVRNYYHTPSDSLSLPSNEVRAIFVDAKGRIFVACTYGSAIYNRASDNFKPLRLANGETVNARSFIGEDKGVFIAGTGKFYFFDSETGTVDQLPVDGGSTYSYISIAPWENDQYVLTTRWDGLWLFDRRHNTVRRLEGVDSRDIMTAAVDSKDRLWVSPYSDGIYVYDSGMNLIKRFQAATSELSNDIVLTMVEKDGRMWIGSDGGGVDVYDLDKDNFVSDVEGSDLSQPRAVTTLHVDKRGNVYGGTTRSGAFLVVPLAMNTMKLGGDSPMGIVTSACVDSDGSLWFGNGGFGLSHKRAHSDLIENIEATRKYRVTDVAVLDSGHLLFATYNNGFFTFDKNTGAIAKEPEVLNVLFEQNRGRALPFRLRSLAGGDIAVVSDDIKIYRPASKALTEPDVAPDMPSSAKRLQPFYNDGRRMLSIGGRTITEYDHSTGTHRPLLTMPEPEVAGCAAFDGKDKIYIGTENGVVQADYATGALKPVHGTEGIRANALAIDSLDRLWIGTTQALLLKLPDSPSVSGFGLSDGVSPNEYIANAVVTTARNIYMGGTTGMLTIKLKNVENIISSYEDPQWNIADITVDGKSVLANLNKHGVYEIPAKHSDVKLSIIDMGNNAMRRPAMKYYVDNGSSERAIEEQDRIVNLNFLQEGTVYKIYASSFRPDGTWTRKQYVATVTVPRPWWRSWWAIGALLGVALMAGFRFFRNKMAGRARAAEAQLRKLRRKTARDKKAFAENAGEALRSPLTIIYARAKMLKKKWDEDDNLDSFDNDLDTLCKSALMMDSAIGRLIAPDDGEAGKADKTGRKAAGPATDQAAVSADDDNTPPAGDIDLSRLTAVVAEADRDLCFFIADELAALFDRVFYATDGQKALSLIDKYSPQLVIASASLRTADGDSLCHEIKTGPARGTAVLLLAATDTGIAGGGKARHESPDMLLAKPFDIEQLAAACRRAIAASGSAKR